MCGEGKSSCAQGAHTARQARRQVAGSILRGNAASAQCIACLPDGRVLGFAGMQCMARWGNAGSELAGDRATAQVLLLALSFMPGCPQAGRPCSASCMWTASSTMAVWSLRGGVWRWRSLGTCWHMQPTGRHHPSQVGAFLYANCVLGQIAPGSPAWVLNLMGATLSYLILTSLLTPTANTPHFFTSPFLSSLGCA